MFPTRHFLVPALLAIGLNASAQGPVFGFKGGLNYSTLAIDEVDDENARIGFNAGVFGRTMPSSPVGLQAELLYSSKGTHAFYSGFGGLVDQEVDFNLNYLELPVLVAIRLGEAVEIHGGGYAAWLLSAHGRTEGDLGSGEEELDMDHFSGMDFGAAVGLGFNTGPAQIGLRYTHGFQKVADSEASEAVLGDAMNRCLQAYLALGISGR